jgi:hypothetical protein
METMDFNFEIDNNDLDILYLHTKDAYKGISLDKWRIGVKNDYKEYYIRNLNNLQRYGTPKTFSQWVNGQIISLT